ncbi:MAG: 1-deoxy-D-xylulose-5-phosphate reductoisomerase [Candidatus Riflebacteria bacterium]|nr:1-deoxy-D-xylulose-5-phosphate reductoisomerase [Candidatus Riflebacteria bacterium]
MARNLAILGSTGSIGTSTLDVVRRARDRFRVISLATGARGDLLLDQIREFAPRLVAVADRAAAEELRRRVGPGSGCEVAGGAEGIVAAATAGEADTVVAAISGSAGLVPVVEALRCGKQIALANKEVLVAAGELVASLARSRGVALLPVDSEHSAIFQCLKGEPRAALAKIILTASGGPFRGRPAAQLETVSPEEALRHPRWDMGAKITIDSATLMNKGLEVIEARWLFDIGYDSIEVVVHPESVVHSLVELCDGSVLAQLGMPDMRLPILCALTHPERLAVRLAPALDLAAVGRLTFEKPDTGAFPCLTLAVEAGRSGRTYPAVLSAANEVAVTRFLHGTLSYGGIARLVRAVLEAHAPADATCLATILECDRWAREAARLWEERC